MLDNSGFRFKALGQAVIDPVARPILLLINVLENITDVRRVFSHSKNDTAPKQRRPLTYIRSLAALAVVLIHSAGELLTTFEAAQPYKVSFLTGIGFNSMLRWATPFFIMMSGALMLNVQKNEETPAVFLKKRIKRLLIPFSFWAVVYFLYENRQAFIDAPFPQPQAILNRILFEDAYYHLWFIPMIIGLYIVTPFLRVFVKNAKKGDLEYALGLFLIIPAIQNYFPTLFIIKYMSWFGYIGFFLLGHYLTTFPPTRLWRQRLYVLGGLSVVFHAVATVWVSGHYQVYYDRFFMYSSPNVVLLTIALFTYLNRVNWAKFALKYPLANRFLLYVNGLSFGIYFIHALVLDVLKNGYVADIQIGIYGFMGFEVLPFMGVCLTAVAVTIASLGSLSLLKSIPFVGKWIM